MKLTTEDRKAFTDTFVFHKEKKEQCYHQKIRKHTRRPITIREFNHEIWRQCLRCGAYNDLRKTENCEDCGTKLQYKKK